MTADINQQLLQAAASGNLSDVAEALAKGADVNARQQPQRQRVLQLALDGTCQRAGAQVGVVAHFGQVLAGGFRPFRTAVRTSTVAGASPTSMRTPKNSALHLPWRAVPGSACSAVSFFSGLLSDSAALALEPNAATCGG